MAKKFKTMSAALFSVKLQMSICFKLKWIFKNRANTIFTGNFYQSIEGYRLSTAKNAKETQELLLETHATAYEGLKMIIQKDIKCCTLDLPLLVLRKKYVYELEQQNQPNKNCFSEKLKKRLEKDDDISSFI